MIVLYPQTRPTYWPFPTNPMAWWGYSGDDYATRDGVQIKALKAMLDRLVSGRQTP